MPFSSDSIVTALKHQISCDLGGEVVILNLQDGVYYGLNAVGARIWSLLNEPCSIEELHQSLVREYDVDPQLCAAQLASLLNDLAANGLIEVTLAA
jgi:hypothetical protein